MQNTNKSKPMQTVSKSMELSMIVHMTWAERCGLRTGRVISSPFTITTSPSSSFIWQRRNSSWLCCAKMRSTQILLQLSLLHMLLRLIGSTLSITTTWDVAIISNSIDPTCIRKSLAIVWMLILGYPYPADSVYSASYFLWRLYQSCKR